MRFTRPALALGLVLLVSFSAGAQSQAVKDPNALAVLAQMAAATGWNRLTAPADALATGTFTRLRGEQQDVLSITLKAKGPRKIRTELQDVSSPRTSIVNGYHGAVLSSGRTSPIPSHVAASEQAFVFPFLTDLVAANDADVSVSYLGVEMVRGESANRVEILREPPANFPSREYRRKAVTLTVWVSVSRGLPVQIQYNRFAFDNPNSYLSATRYLSDYRLVGGLLVPFRQEESIQGDPFYTLQLSDVRFNVGISDSEFVVQDQQQ